MTNTLAYYGAELNTAVERFMKQAPSEIAKFLRKIGSSE